jgi:hypothetical protein
LYLLFGSEYRLYLLFMAFLNPPISQPHVTIYGTELY